MDYQKIGVPKKSHVLQIRLSSREREIVYALARLEKLPAATLGRRLLLKEAERCGVVGNSKILEDTAHENDLNGETTDA